MHWRYVFHALTHRLMIFYTVLPPLTCCYRADSRLASSQWETSLQSNAVSHWLGTRLESSLCYVLRLSMNIEYMISENFSTHLWHMIMWAYCWQRIVNILECIILWVFMNKMFHGLFVLCFTSIHKYRFFINRARLSQNFPLAVGYNYSYMS